MTRLQEGVIGTIRHVRADFAFRVPRDPEGPAVRSRAGRRRHPGRRRLPGVVRAPGRGLGRGRAVRGAGAIRGERRHRPHRRGRDGDRVADVRFRPDGRRCTSAVFHDVGHDGGRVRRSGKIVLPDPWIPQSKRQAWRPASRSSATAPRPRRSPIRTDMATYAIEAELVADIAAALRSRLAGDDLGRHAWVTCASSMRGGPR